VDRRSAALGRAHGLRGDTVLDVGCGTGNSFLPLLALGWKVTAADLSPSMVERALRAMAANLAPHGTLIFDSNTLATYRTFFGERVEVEANRRRLIWNGQTGGHAEPGQISESIFEVEPLTPGSGPPVPPEVHRQRHHPEAELRDALSAAGLEVAGLYGCTTDGVPRQPVNEDSHTKSIYITRFKQAT
jgi:SAM-dependent methyltransferase